MRRVILGVVLALLAGAVAVPAEEEAEQPTDEEAKRAVALALTYVGDGKVIMNNRPLETEQVELVGVEYAAILTRDIMVKFKVKGTECGQPAGRDTPNYVVLELTFDQEGEFRGGGIGIPPGVEDEPQLRFLDDKKDQQE